LIGLIDKVSTPEQLMNDALEFANLLAERPPIAVSCILKTIVSGTYEGIEKGLEVERESSQLLSKTEDAREGIIAFLEKRPPVFKEK